MTQNKKTKTTNSSARHTNLLLTETLGTPFETLPFGAVTGDDIKEAILKGIESEDSEIDKILSNPETPTFNNTYLPLNDTGKVLDRAVTMMEHLLGCATSDKLETMAQELTPALSEHSNNIQFNKKLYERLKAVQNAHPKLTPEEQKDVDDTCEGFELRGIALPKAKQQRLREISIEAGRDSLQFSQNVLKDTNRFLAVVKDKKELKGLPAHQLEIAAQTAKEKGKEGYAFTLQGPSVMPVLTYCDNRELRRKIWMAHSKLCCHGGKSDNRALVKKLVNLRLEMAKILGFECFADLALRKRMAGTKERVDGFLDELVEKYKPRAKEERKELDDFAKKLMGADFVMRPWDRGYFSHKLQLERYDVDAEKLRPYLPLDRVINGVFGLANTLYGISFKENREIPVWDRDVKVYEVYDENKCFLAILYADFHPRANKKSGGWTNELKGQYIKEDGTNVRPQVCITMNFTKPTEKKPSLLSLGEVSTFLHEFGHALHQIFSNTRFESQSGTNVYWDFVELPSQLMENFAIEKNFLHTFATHYQTGEPMPDELIGKVRKSQTYNAAGACMRQVSLAMLDMAFYTLKDSFDEDVETFEKKAWKKAVFGSQKLKVCMTTQFNHIMTGGYAAGYYSYKWAEVLDADAFSLFKENGVFSKEIASRFRHEILEKGGTKDPNELYMNFRKQKPTIDALLRRDGILK